MIEKKRKREKKNTYNKRQRILIRIMEIWLKGWLGTGTMEYSGTSIKLSWGVIYRVNSVNQYPWYLH